MDANAKALVTALLVGCSASAAAETIPDWFARPSGGGGGVPQASRCTGRGYLVGVMVRLGGDIGHLGLARRAKPGAPPADVRLVLTLDLRRTLAEPSELDSL